MRGEILRGWMWRFDKGKAAVEGVGWWVNPL